MVIRKSVVRVQGGPYPTPRAKSVVAKVLSWFGVSKRPDVQYHQRCDCGGSYKTDMSSLPHRYVQDTFPSNHPVVCTVCGRQDYAWTEEQYQRSVSHGR